MGSRHGPFVGSERPGHFKGKKEASDERRPQKLT